LSAFLLLAVAFTPARAEQEIQVFDNGVQLEVETASMDGQTLIPMRAIFEVLGAEVTWDGATWTENATWNGGSLTLPIGSTEAILSGQTVQLDVPAQLIDSRTMVPLRFVGESMGALVGWYGSSWTITINKPAQSLIPATVINVVDGDAVDVALADGIIERVRLIGVDTPEVHG